MFRLPGRVLSTFSSLSSRNVSLKATHVGSLAMTTTAADEGNAKSLDDDDASSSNNKKRQAPSNRSSKQRSNDKNGSRRRRAWEEPAVDDVAPGSYAHASLRALLSIELPSVATEDSNEDETKLPSKKKVAMLVGYLGTNYGGFQMNADQRTVQAEIELALLKAKLLTKANFGYPFKYNWSTSGRTDKGVHACAQVCAAKLQIGDDGDTETGLETIRTSINQQLPDDIAVLQVARTTRGFCAKNMRAHVRYQYMIPSFCLHPDLKGVFQDHNITWSAAAGSDTNHRQASDPLTADEIKTMQKALHNYRATPEQLQRLSQALATLQGTHSFHYFTKSVSAKDAKATRYIVSYICLPPVIVNGMEWIPTQVVGQSFLVYQVRKMTSLAIDIARGVAPVSVMELALEKNSNVRLNVAPAQGLLKEMSYYGGYNQRKRQTSPDLPDLEWDKEGSAVCERWSDFKERVIEHIVNEEVKYGNFIKYLFNQEFIFGLRQHYRLEDPSVAVANEIAAEVVESEDDQEDSE